jgi:glucosyl-3-phosphoglycerate synthase
VIAQVDLEKRVHRNQDTRALGKMAFVILNTFLRRIEKQDRIQLKRDLFNEMIQYNLVRNTYEPDILKIHGLERPPIIEIPEYRNKFNIN